MSIIHETLSSHMLSLIIYDGILIKLNKRLNSPQIFTYYYYIPVRNTNFFLICNLEMGDTKKETLLITFYKVRGLHYLYYKVWGGFTSLQMGYNINDSIKPNISLSSLSHIKCKLEKFTFCGRLPFDVCSIL